MTDLFFERPILNSPYDYPARHWELDEIGQPTDRILDSRHRSGLCGGGSGKGCRRAAATGAGDTTPGLDDIPRRQDEVAE